MCSLIKAARTVCCMLARCRLDVLFPRPCNSCSSLVYMPSLVLTLWADLWTHHASPAEIHRRWPEMIDYDNPSGGASELERNRTGGGQPPQCQLAVSALLRGGGRRGPGLTPDASCVPPRALCHYLPRGVCTPARLDERTHAVVQSTRSYGIRPRRGFRGLFALRCVHAKCTASKPGQVADVSSAPKKQSARPKAEATSRARIQHVTPHQRDSHKDCARRKI